MLEDPIVPYDHDHDDDDIDDAAAADDDDDDNDVVRFSAKATVKRFLMV